MASSWVLNKAEMKYSQRGYINTEYTHTHTLTHRHKLALASTCLALTVYDEMMRLKADLVLWVSR